MRRSYITSAFAGALLLGLGTTAALAVTGEFNNMCTEGLSLGKDVNTDCSINAAIGGKTYCFGSEQAKTDFMKDPEGNMAKAQAYYKTKHPGIEGPSAYRRRALRARALMLDLRASCLRLVGMDTDISSADLQRLLGVAPHGSERSRQARQQRHLRFGVGKVALNESP